MGTKRAAPALAGLVLAASTVLAVTAGASTRASTTVRTVTSSRAAPMYYVSLGDSYSVGYQPDPALSMRFGYTRFVVASEQRRGTTLTLVNFGCAGATTNSLLTSIGCPAPLRAIRGAPYSTVSQATAATQFIAAHRRHIALITVSIGGNDVTQCAFAASPISCVAGVVPSVAANITTLLKEIRTAAGHTVHLVGLTYPDVILGQWVHPPVSKSLAALSVPAFKVALNPVLQRAYTAEGGTFVDVTKATGAYTPLSHTTLSPTYGRIPVAVANVCTYTWYCAEANIHPRTAGYRLIAGLIVAALPAHLG